MLAARRSGGEDARLCITRDVAVLCRHDLHAAFLLTAVRQLTEKGKLTDVQITIADLDEAMFHTVGERTIRTKLHLLARWGFLSVTARNGHPSRLTFHAEAVEAALCADTQTPANVPRSTPANVPGSGQSPADLLGSCQYPGKSAAVDLPWSVLPNQQLSPTPANVPRLSSKELFRDDKSSTDDERKTFPKMATNGNGNARPAAPAPVPAAGFSAELIAAARYEIMLAMSKCGEDRLTRTYVIDDVDAAIALAVLRAGPWEASQALIKELAARGTLKVSTPAYFADVTWQRFRRDKTGWRRKQPGQAFASRSNDESVDFSAALGALTSARRMR